VKPPTLTVIAGPNGSGKSTLTSSIWFEGNSNLIDPDTIARSIDPVQPARAAIPAARRSILRCKALLAGRESFTPEKTLAGHGAMTIMKDPELHIERVRLRVSRGGHDIPDADIRRRYARSLMHAREALRLADEAVVLDNSGLHPVRMLLFENGVVVWRAAVLSEWVGTWANWRSPGTDLYDWKPASRD
jgi:predicted ABC-type ATPase